MTALLATLAWADDPPPPADPPPAEESPPPVDPRDADIFGTPTAVPVTVEPTDTGALGEIDFVPTSNDNIADKLDARDDTLAIGGSMYQRLDLSLGEGQEVAATRVSGPTLLDLYVDARPNDRLRLYTRARLDHDFTVQPLEEDDPAAAFTRTERDRVAVDQLWTKFDVGRKVFVTLGQQRVKWGAGRFWNPTDFMNQQTLDPLQSVVFDNRTGVGLVKLHAPFSKAGLDVYARANLEGVKRVDEVGGAVRAEWVSGSTAVSASAAARKDQPIRLGGDVSTGIGSFDFKVEGAVRHGDTTPYWEGPFEPTDRSDEWIPEVLGGVELAARYNDEDALYVGAEFFYNGAGYDDVDVYPWLLLNGQYRPFYLGEQYVSAYVLVPSPGQWDDASFTGSFIANLSDSSYVGRLDYSQSTLTFLRLGFNASYYFGADGEFHYPINVPGVYEAPAPMLGVGASASISF